MERDEQQLTGWRSFRFGFGQSDTPVMDAPEISKRGDKCCTQEDCGFGCYIALVDADLMDQEQ